MPKQQLFSLDLLFLQFQTIMSSFKSVPCTQDSEFIIVSLWLSTQIRSGERKYTWKCIFLQVDMTYIQSHTFAMVSACHYNYTTAFLWEDSLKKIKKNYFVTWKRRNWHTIITKKKNAIFICCWQKVIFLIPV